MAQPIREYDDGVYYVYGRVQTKPSKEKEILREYGYEIRRQEEVASEMRSHRRYGRAFAEDQRRRARPKRDRDSGRTVRTDGGGYIYRPKGVPHGAGGARAEAKASHYKLVLSKLVNMFESVEEKAKNDERIAKRRAVMEKQWSENKHNIITALFLVLLTVAILLGVYKLFFVVREVDAGVSAYYTAEELTEASGIELGDSLYSFSSSDIESEITFKCPYIKEATVTRTIPTKVNIDVEDDTAVYSANIWGDRVELSAGLKVLGKTTAEKAEADGLITLVLPPVKYSVAGRVIEFTDEKNERLVRSVLEETEASSAGQAGEITMIDLTDEYDIRMEASGMYSLKFGSENDIGLKLRMFYKTITSGSIDRKLKALIDLTTVGEACVKYEF